jgi:flagellar hook-associated protein 3 FlgL
MTTPLRNNLLNQFTRIRSNLLGMKGQLIERELSAASGLRVQKPSDAPELLTSISRLRNAISDQPVYQQNIDRGRAILDVAETAVADGVEIMKRAQELVVNMSSESFGAFERTQAATEVNALRERMLAAANRDIAGRYVFSGKNYEVASYDNTGTFQGTTTEPQTIIGKDNRLTIGFDGSAIFEGTADPLQTLADLATALETNDIDATQASLTTVQASVQQLIDARARIGTLWNDAEQAEEISVNLSEYMNTQLQSSVGTDPIQVYSEIAHLRTAYEGALQVSAQSNRFKLLDYLR